MYRLLRSFFARSQHWQQYDPFSAQKVSAFKSSASAIKQLADAVEPLIKKAESAAQDLTNGKQSGGLEVMFRELVQTSLWGNATDLSLLTNMTHADIQQLQAGGVGAEAQKKREHFVLSGLDGIQEAWDSLVAQRQAKGGTEGQGRIDILLDNSGFELYTDLLLADFLLSSGMADQIVFHPKDMPWFVSDVTPADFCFTLEALQSADFFKKAADDKAPSGPPRASRSTSRQRELVADERHFEGERRDMSPVGSRVLQMKPVPEENSLSQSTGDAHAYGSRTLTMKESEEKGRSDQAIDAIMGERGRPTWASKATNSQNLQLDKSYFQNARSRTVSPSRSYVIDSGSMASFSSAMGARSGTALRGADDEGRGRSSRSEHTTSTQRLANRWAQYMASGKFTLSMSPATPLGGSPQLHATSQADFWTSFHNYPSVPQAAPNLYAALAQSRLVLSKGDLNYRKWTSDARWPFDEPFANVLGPVRGKLNLLVLRTNKADVCVGVPSERLKGLDSEDPQWRTNGKFAMIEFVGKGDAGA